MTLDQKLIVNGQCGLWSSQGLESRDALTVDPLVLHGVGG